MKNVEDDQRGERKLQGNDNTTLTPAGPLPSDKVHEVKAGKKVHRNADGTYTIIPLCPSQDEPPQSEDSQKQTDLQDDPGKEEHNG